MENSAAHSDGISPARARGRRLRATPRFWRLLAGIVLVWVVASFASGVLKIVRLQGELRRLEAQAESVRRANEALRSQIEYMQSQAYIERVAREKLGLIKPGETLYVPSTEVPPDDPYIVPRRPGVVTDPYQQGY